MKPQELRSRIRKLRETASVTAEFERVLTKRGAWDRSRVWYTTQKEYWLGWLSQYGGAGAYGRKNFNHSAEFAYNHICCPPMLLWLGEAAGASKPLVAKAKRAALAAQRNFSAQCAAIRKVIPWKAIELRLNRDHRARIQRKAIRKVL